MNVPANVRYAEIRAAAPNGCSCRLQPFRGCGAQAAGYIGSLMVYGRQPSRNAAGTSAGTVEMTDLRFPLSVKVLPQRVQLRPGAPDPSDHPVSGEPNALMKYYENGQFEIFLGFLTMGDDDA